MNSLSPFLALFLPLLAAGGEKDLLEGGMGQWEAFGRAEWKVRDGVLEGGQGGLAGGLGGGGW